MESITRRTLNEIETRYTLEPELEDLYVEGAFDKDVISAASQCLKNSRKVIYTIDTIEIPSETLAQHRLTDGNKQRVIALSKELNKIGAAQKCICLVDKDYDHLIGNLQTNTYLKWTIHASLDMHFLSKEIFDEILLTMCKIKVKGSDELFYSLIQVLISISILRIADRTLAWNMSWISFDKSLQIRNEKIIFDQHSYISKLLNANSRMTKINEYMEQVNLWKNLEQEDPKNVIRGHDFYGILYWIVKFFRKTDIIASVDAIQAVFKLKTQNSREISQEINKNL